MTRCGTPCWTAPEVLRGQEYNEKADIYSFGIILWELITRAQPFADQNFIGVTMQVLQGVRPAIPSQTKPELAELITQCWDDSPKKRPKLKKMLKYFEGELSGEGIDAV
jgi:serine/threonine protein kinase